MLKIIFGIFVLLHGLVHLLYFGHSQKLFKLQKGLKWPENSIVLKKYLSPGNISSIASFICIIATIVLVGGSILYFINNSLWKTTILTGTGISSLLYLVFWDGKLKKLDDNGGIAILINIAIFLAISVIKIV